MQRQRRAIGLQTASGPVGHSAPVFPAPARSEFRRVKIASLISRMTRKTAPSPSAWPCKAAATSVKKDERSLGASGAAARIICSSWESDKWMGLSMDGDREMVSRLLLVRMHVQKTPSRVWARGGVITSKVTADARPAT